MNPPELNELIDQVRHRDRTAFAQIVRTYEHELLRTAYRVVGQQADAEEVRQIVFLRIWQSPENIPESTTFGYWIRRCVINEAIEVLRRQQREQKRNSNSLLLRPAESGPEEWDDEAENLKTALDNLEPEQRAILSLRFDEACTIREIGSILDQSYTTVQSKLNRSIDRLRELLNLTVKNVESRNE